MSAIYTISVRKRVEIGCEVLTHVLDSGMGSPRTKIVMSDEQLAELKQRISKATDVREKERLQVVFWATTGQYTLDEMPTLSGRVRSTKR